MLLFDPIRHIYFEDNDTYQFLSATTFIKLAQEEYDTDYWTDYKSIESVFKANNRVNKWFAIKDIVKEFRKDKRYDLAKKLLKQTIDSSEYKHIILRKKEVFKTTWKNKSIESCNHGTAIHLLKEKQRYAENGWEWKDDDFEAVMNDKSQFKCCSDVFDFEYDVWHPEMTLFAKDYDVIYKDKYYNGIAGTADEVKIEKINDYRVKLHINDWKTNAELKVSNWFQKLNYPLSHLDDCDFNIYRLQLSLYLWMIKIQFEAKGFDVEIGECNITHIDRVMSETVYKFKPLFKEINLLLNEFTVKRSNEPQLFVS